MSRIIPNKDPWHRITIQDAYGGVVTLVGTGRGAYLSVHTNNVGPKGFSYLSGRSTLRRLAYSILRTVPAKRRKTGVAR